MRKAVLWYTKIRRGLQSQFIDENHLTQIANYP